MTKLNYNKIKHGCSKRVKWYLENFGKKNYTISEAIKKAKTRNDVRYSDVSWLMVNCPELRTKTVLDYYKSLKPDYENVRWLMVNCPELRTKTVLGYYLSLEPDYKNVRWLMVNCPEFRTESILDYYLSLKPDYEDLSWLMINCPELQQYIKK